MKKAILIQIGELDYLIDAELVEEIMTPVKLTKLPLSNSHNAEGIFFLRNEVIITYHSKNIFNIDNCENTQELFLIVKLEDKKMAIIINDIHEMVNLEHDLNQCDKFGTVLIKDKIFNILSKNLLNSL